MDVWFSWCHRKATCPWCNKPIEKATPMVVKKLWRKGDPDSRKFNLWFYYHPECYLAEGLDYLKMNPYVARGEKRGPKPKLVELTTIQQKRRLWLLRKHGELLQRRKLLKTPYPDRILFETRINNQLFDLMVEIAQIGGIPEKWVTNLLNS